MSVILAPLVTNGASATNFIEYPSISNPQLTSTNTTFLATTAQVKTAIPTPNSATELVTNIAQTITGTLNMLGNTAIRTIDLASIINIGIPSNIISLGLSTLTTLNINAITQWSSFFPRFAVTNNVTTGGSPAGWLVGKHCRGGIADTTGANTLSVSIPAGVFTNPPTVILTPIPRTSLPNTVLSYGWYYVSGVTTTSFTINTEFTGRRYNYLLIGS